jgi:hypothetical protein
MPVLENQPSYFAAGWEIGIEDEVNLARSIPKSCHTVEAQ